MEIKFSFLGDGTDVFLDKVKKISEKTKNIFEPDYILSSHSISGCRKYLTKTYIPAPSGQVTAPAPAPAPAQRKRRK